ncbi:acyloxyacyl hydrolase [Marinifilum sp. RC60d5]|uniref:acyloxyacyl hydrolase n=1 Tax=Marinifilum sp. RC60d5 TaxID=3458414 RepID=UPI0040367072
MKNRILFILSILVSNILMAQKTPSKDIFTTSLRYHYGVILPHHKSISYLVNDQISGIELNLGIVPNRDKNWVSLYKNPEYGIGIYHTSLGNDKILGKATAVFPYINFPIARKNKWEFNFQLGFGMAYTKKHFDPVDNYTNVAIGSKFNAFIKLMTTGSYSIHPKWNVNGGIEFFHISNGAISVPNKGLNAVTTNFGVSYYLSNKRTHKKYTSINYSKLENEFSLIWNSGIKQTGVKDPHKYYKTGLSLSYLKGINTKQRVGLGIDFFYDTSANRGNWNFEPKTGFNDRFSQSFFVSHELFIQKFIIVANIGVYTLYKTEPEKPVYTRIGLRYALGKHLLASLCLKSHLGKADYIEWGIGYRINTKKNEKG